MPAVPEVVVVCGAAGLPDPPKKAATCACVGAATTGCAIGVATGALATPGPGAGRADAADEAAPKTGAFTLGCA